MIYVKMLGTTVVEVDGVALPDGALGGRLLQVLEILALNAGSPVPKEVLADQVWDGAPPPTYVGTLESYVCVLRKRLGLVGGRRSSLATRERGYILGGPDVEVDIQRFDNLTHAASRRTAQDRIRAACAALELVRGPLLADQPYAGWAVHAREAFDHELAKTLVPLAALAIVTGDHEAAGSLARVVTDHDPYCEAAWQQVIRAHWLAGEPGAALRAYAALRQVLFDDLGERPSPQSQELYLTILRAQEEARPATLSQELGLLLRLLRRALEGTPGVAVPVQDSALASTAMGVLGRLSVVEEPALVSLPVA
jgi:DNA-binding SARP family transcriptional activator